MKLDVRNGDSNYFFHFIIVHFELHYFPGKQGCSINFQEINEFAEVGGQICTGIQPMSAFLHIKNLHRERDVEHDIRTEFPGDQFKLNVCKFLMDSAVVNIN